MRYDTGFLRYTDYQDFIKDQIKSRLIAFTTSCTYWDVFDITEI